MEHDGWNIWISYNCVTLDVSNSSHSSRQDVTSLRSRFTANFWLLLNCTWQSWIHVPKGEDSGIVEVSRKTRAFHDLLHLKGKKDNIILHFYFLVVFSFRVLLFSHTWVPKGCISSVHHYQRNSCSLLTMVFTPLASFSNAALVREDNSAEKFLLRMDMYAVYCCRTRGSKTQTLWSVGEKRVKWSCILLLKHWVIWKNSMKCNHVRSYGGGEIFLIWCSC